VISTVTCDCTADKGLAGCHLQAPCHCTRCRNQPPTASIPTLCSTSHGANVGGS